jgi:AraC-like DNA-binding protein
LSSKPFYDRLWMGEGIWGPNLLPVLRETGLSERRFIEVFHEQVGLTPKAFCRVRRFQRVLKSVHGAREVDWAQVALDCGYYDQPHFIHDFRGFSGLTPAQYVARATASSEPRAGALSIFGWSVFYNPVFAASCKV